MKKIRTGLKQTVSLASFMLAFSFVAASLPALGAETKDNSALLKNFITPPASAKPRMWWHWMDGNITISGLDKDLAWMHKIGIGGLSSVDASMGTKQVVKDRRIFMTPAWQEAYTHYLKTAHGYGIESGIFGSPGWSESGGPWVRPAQAMKKLVWTATNVTGGAPFHGKLAVPPDNTGTIQNAPMNPYLMPPTEKAIKLKYYHDAQVIAYRLPVSDAAVKSWSDAAGAVSGAALSDGDLVKGVDLKADARGEAWLQADFGAPVTVQGLTLALKLTGLTEAEALIESSTDGKVWTSVSLLRPDRFIQHSISFAPVTARFFRVLLRKSTATPAPSFMHPVPGASMAALGPMAKPVPVSFHVKELTLHRQATVNAFEAKADFYTAPDYYALNAKAPIVPGSAVAKADVVDLTAKMQPDGTLDWTPPKAGRWVILRMGYSLEGTENHPATKESTGLEVDKLNKADVTAYAAHYLDMYQKMPHSGHFGKDGLHTITFDSTEVGAQNWTNTLLADFKRLRGYDPTPYLPALTGIVVGSKVDSDKFLWDFRRTINDLLADNHYKTLVEAAHARGLTVYGEALEDHRPTFGDDMDMRRFADYPMSAMWSYGTRREPNPDYVADVEGAASIAHIYGRKFVATESMTSALAPWDFAPRTLKPIMDMEFISGTNRPVIHSSVHQPLDKAPGLSLWIFGQYFNRLESWAPYARPWISYIARSSYLLQQGQYVADIAYFYGQEAPITGLYGDRLVSDVPKGYRFDFVNDTALKEAFSVKNGQLCTKSGMQYRVLYLGGTSRYMTYANLKRLAALVKSGAVVVGKKPLASPSLADDPAAFTALANQLFGASYDGVLHSFGQGKVYSAGDLAGALQAMHVAPDFSYSGEHQDTEILDMHRHIKDGEIYFLSNRLGRAEKIKASFRVAGLKPQLWDAVTGKVRDVSYDIDKASGQTQIPLDMAAHGSVFVVFRSPAVVAHAVVRAPAQHVAQALTGPWTLSFAKNLGAPDHVTLPALSAWNDSKDAGVKYFSGTGTYDKDFTVSAGDLAGKQHFLLDLGTVRELAQVSVNGKDLGMLWTAPYKVDITSALKPGKNHLEIKVTNLWVNRLIGDAQPGVKKTYTFTAVPTYVPNAPLRQSGLIGPVRLEVSAR